MDKAVKRYLARLRRVLTCPKEDRDRLLSRGGSLLAEFAAETPNAGYRELTAAFGQPGDFAAGSPSFRRRRWRRPGSGGSTYVGVLWPQRSLFWRCSRYFGTFDTRSLKAGMKMQLLS